MQRSCVRCCLPTGRATISFVETGMLPEKQTPRGAQLGGTTPRGVDTAQGVPVCSAGYSTRREHRPGHASQGAPAPLGKTTESSGGPSAGSAENRRANRALRFEMQRHMWALLPDRRRLQACHTMAAQVGHGVFSRVEVRGRIREDGSLACHYGGVARCASPWVCPICAPVIAQRRAGEIRKAREAWQKEGGRVLLVSLTFRHGRGEKLADNVAGLRKARERLRARKPFRQLRSDVGMVGHISALEVTHGQANGWHPHLHEYWFVAGDVDPREVERRLYEHWADCCEKQGLGRPSRKHGVDVVVVRDKGADCYAVQGADLSSTVDLELSGGLEKRGRGGNHSMWELLLLSMRGDRRAGALWREYAETLLGRASLFWSQGLKDRFGIGELTDEEAAELEEAEGVTICQVDNWYLVRRFGQRAAVLAAAEAGGRAAVQALTDRLRRRADAELEAYFAGRSSWAH